MTSIRRVSRFHRFADRYAGIPLLFLPSLCRKKRQIPDDISRICLIKTSGIGDIVLMSAVVKDILKHYIGCHITVVTGVHNYFAAKYILGRLCCSIEFKIADHSDMGTLNELRKLDEFDLTMDFGQWPRFDAMVSMLIRSRFRLGFSREGQHRHHCYDMSVAHRSDRHEINNFRALAEAVGIYCLYGHEIGEIYRHSDIEENSITIHMCASGHTGKQRMWGMGKWAELIRRLDDMGYDIIFTGTIAEKGYIEAVGMSAGLEHLHTMLDRHFEELAPVMKRSRYVISVDTGIAHFAAACGANLIELLGPTNPERWGAIGENVTYIRPASVGDMLDLGHEDADFDAMNRITVDMVLTYIKDSGEFLA